MSYIIHRKIKKTTYVIEVTSYRNKEGKPRNKQRCLGKLDDDGVLISSKTKLPAQITEVKKVVKRFIVKELNTNARSEPVKPTPTPCTNKAFAPTSFNVNKNMINRPYSAFKVFIQDSDDNIQFRGPLIYHSDVYASVC